VIILPDGRLGLIDYGMVGRLDTEARRSIAGTILALARGDKQAVADAYRDAGYDARWHASYTDTRGVPHGRDAVHRIASFHLDRIDLSPVRAGPEEAQMPVVRMLVRTIEHAVPDWIEQGRRLGGLLIGVASQAGRPISLAHDWTPIAEEVLADT
jgi:hypothetical protein